MDIRQHLFQWQHIKLRCLIFQDSGDGPISIPSSPEKNGAEDQEEEGEGGEEEEQE